MKFLNSDKAGSDRHSEPAFVLIGHLQRAHGIHGEITMYVMSDFPQTIYKGKTVFLGSDHRAMIVASVRNKNDLLLLSFENIDFREDVRTLTNLDVYLAIRDLPPVPKGTYYHHQLIGMQVYEEDQNIGTLTEVLVTGANDVYVIKELAGGELLLPAIASVIKHVDLEQMRMTVSVSEGLRG